MRTDGLGGLLVFTKPLPLPVGVLRPMKRDPRLSGSQRPAPEFARNIRDQLTARQYSAQNVREIRLPPETRRLLVAYAEFLEELLIAKSSG
jgi:hypothetical protein